MKVAVFTSVYNRYHIITEAIPKIYENSKSKNHMVHHFIGDNNSEKPVKDFLSKFALNSNVYLFKEKENLGKSGILRKMERAIDLMKYEIYVNIDSDVIPPKGWIDQICNVLNISKDFNFSILGPTYKVIPEYEPSKHYQSPQTSEITIGNFNIMHGGGLSGGCFFCFVREWRDLKGYSDLGKFSFGDDVDLVRKIRAKGKITGVVKEIEVYHFPAKKEDEKYMAWKNKNQNRLRTFLKQGLSVPQAAKIILAMEAEEKEKEK